MFYPAVFLVHIINSYVPCFETKSAFFSYFQAGRAKNNPKRFTYSNLYSMTNPKAVAKLFLFFDKNTMFQKPVVLLAGFYVFRQRVLGNTAVSSNIFLLSFVVGCSHGLRLPNEAFFH